MLSNISYPYPVMGNNDDISGVFMPIHYGVVKDEEVELNIDYNLEQPFFSSLITNGDAKFVTEISCPATFFRKTYYSTDVIHSIKIPARQLRERIEMKFYIIATNRMLNYAPEGCSPPFENLTFSIYPGDILALGGSNNEIIEKDFDPLSAPASSFIKTQFTDDKNGKISINYDEDDFIFIRIPKKMGEAYNEIKNIRQDAVHSSIVFPALIDIFYKTRENGELSDRAWYRRLEEICAKRGLDMENDEPINMAQEILKNPVERTIKNLMLSEEDGDD